MEQILLSNQCSCFFPKVSPSSPALAVSGHSPLMPGLAIYSVRVVNFSSFQQMASPVFINLSCVLTSQSEAVLVRVVAEKPGAGEQPKGERRENAIIVFQENI